MKVVTPHIRSVAATAVAVAGLALASLPIVSHAALVVTTFSDEGSFLSAAGLGLSLATFDGLGNNTYQTLSNAQSPLIPTGVTFSSTGGGAADLFVAPAGFGGQADIDSDSLFANFFGTPLIASFSPGVTAIGSEVISYVGSATILVTIADALGNLSSISVTPAVNDEAYLGLVVSGGQIASISWDPPNDFTAGIDNFRFGQAAAAVPEPATLGLVAIALFGMLARGRRKEVGLTARDAS